MITRYRLMLQIQSTVTLHKLVDFYDSLLEFLINEDKILLTILTQSGYRPGPGLTGIL
jgi:hypothetical protein